MSLARAWEVWARNPDFRDSDSYVTAYTDKGQAQDHMRRLKRSHPHVTYFLKHRKYRPGSTTQTASRRRARARKRMGG